MVEPIDTTVGKSRLRVDAGSISYGAALVPWAQATGWTYWWFRQVVNGVTTTNERHFVVTGSGETIDVKMPGANQALQAQLINSAIECLATRLLNEMVTTIAEGGEVGIGGVTIRKSGLSHKKMLGGVKYLTWDGYGGTRDFNGDTILKAKRANGKATATFATVPGRAINSPMLEPLLTYVSRLAL